MKEREPLGINLGEKISQTLAKKQREMDDIAQKNILEQGGKRLAEEARAALEINDFALAEAKIAELKNLLKPQEEIVRERTVKKHYIDLFGRELEFSDFQNFASYEVGNVLENTSRLRGDVTYEIVGFTSGFLGTRAWLHASNDVENSCFDVPIHDLDFNFQVKKNNR